MRLPAMLCAMALLVWAGAAPRAQTLDECLALARRNAPAIRVADAELSRAEQAIREARAALSPAVHLSGNLVQNSEAQRTVFQLPGAPSAGAIKIASATVLDARVTGEYMLYSGGRNGALVRAAQASEAARLRDRDRAAADLVMRVSQAFYRAIAAQRLEAAAEEAIASARAHRATSAARVAAGAAPRLDSLRARVDLAQRTTALVRATEAVRIARVELETAIGASLDPAGQLVEPEGPSLELPEVAVSVEGALLARPELASLDAALRENELRRQAVLAARRPNLSLSATAQYLGPNRDEDYWNTADAGLRTHKFFAGVGLTMPLFDAGLTAARAGEMEAGRVALEARRKDLELGVRREVEQAVSDLRVAQSEWQSDSGRVVTAREALRVAEAGYKGGTGSATDVRDAEAALADARGDEAQSLMSYWVARASFDRATGATVRREK